MLENRGVEWILTAWPSLLCLSWTVTQPNLMPGIKNLKQEKKSQSLCYRSKMVFGDATSRMLPHVSLSKYVVHLCDILPFSSSSTRQDRDFGCQRSNREKLLSRKYHVFIDFICDDGNAVFFTNLQQLSNVRFREDWTTRIGRIVVNYGNRVCVNLWLQVIQINFPLRVWKEVVRTILNAISSTEGLVQRKSWPWNQDVLSRRAKESDTQVQGMRGSTCQEDILRNKRVSLLEESAWDCDVMFDLRVPAFFVNFEVLMRRCRRQMNDIIRHSRSECKQINTKPSFSKQRQSLQANQVFCVSSQDMMHYVCETHFGINLSCRNWDISSHGFSSRL